MIVFYGRCSTADQNLARQKATAAEIGADKEFYDQATGKNVQRQQLKEMLNFVREGDTVVCSDISRIARNTKDLLGIVETLREKDVEFKSLKEAIDTTTPHGKFMLTVFGALAELERESILERQREGIAIAKAEGKYTGRKKIELDEVAFRKSCEEWRAEKRTAASIQREFGISPQTFYRRVKEYHA